MSFYLVSGYRNAFRGLTREAWFLSFVMLINRAGTMVVPFMTMYLTQHMGFTLAKAGWVMAIFGAGAIAGSLTGGRITDKIGFYPVQLTALTGGGLLFILLGQMQTYTGICIVTFFLSFVNEAFRPANQTAMAWFSKPESRTRSFTLNRLAINLGWAFGGALGGFLSGRNYTLLFWVDGLTNLLAAFLLLLLIPYAKTKKAVQQKAQQQQASATPAYRDRNYMIFIAFMTVFAICFFQSFTTLPVFYKEKWHITETTIGYIMAFNGILIALVEMPFVKFAESRFRVLPLIVAGVVVTGFSYGVLNLLTPSVFSGFISMFLFTVGEILAMPFTNTYWISRSNAANRGSYASLFTVSFATAQVTGPYSGAQVADFFGFNWLWWLTLALCLFAAAGFHYLKKQPG